MFDWVRYKTKCPVCGKTVTGFQTKGGPGTMSTLKPKDARWFYSECGQCERWVDVEVIVDSYRLKEHWRPVLRNQLLLSKPKFVGKLPPSKKWNIKINKTKKI